MWTIIIRAAALLGVGAALGSSISNTPVIQPIPQPIYQEAAGTLSPFLVLAFALLLGAAGYFVWSLRRRADEGHGQNETRIPTITNNTERK